MRGFFRHGNIGYLFVLPAITYMVLLVGYPIVSNFILSIQDVTVTTLNAVGKPLVGFRNYQTLMADDVLLRSLGNTFIFTIGCLVFQFAIGFGLALLFNAGFPIAKPIRGLLMIPWMIPMTVTALMFKFMFSSNVGIINQFLQALGIIKSPVEWLLEPRSAMFSLIVANIWIGIPFNMILLSTGLTTIPKDVKEAAAIDGASKWQSFLFIISPMLRPVIESVLILGFIYTFKVFDLVFVMTNGGPVNSTHLLSTYSYKLSFVLFKYSQGSATANILFLILLAVSIFYLKFVYDDRRGPMMSRARRLRTVVLSAVAIVIFVVAMFPLYWMVVTSLKKEIEIFQVPPTLLPHVLNTDSYFAQLQHGDFNMFRSFKNSFVISSCAMLLALVLAIPASYGIARFTFKGKRAFILGFLVTQMLPVSVLLTPMFIIFKNVHLLNTQLSAILSDVTIGVPFSVLILMGYFASMPKELEDASCIDGCNRFSAFLRIFLPIASPGVIVCAVFSFLYGWGDLAYGMTFLQDQAMRPITAGIFNFMGQYGTKWSYLSAFAVVTIVPVIFIFVFMQKYIISGLTSGAVKG